MPNLVNFLVVLLVLLCSRWNKFVFDLNIAFCILPSNQCKQLAVYNDYKIINGREHVDGFESKLHELVDPPWILMCMCVCLCVYVCTCVCVFVCVCT